jgi:hypothetical protein
MKNKFHPILFSTPMVQALLDGRKTQTRRIVKLQPDSSQKVGISKGVTLDGTFLLQLVYSNDDFSGIDFIFPKYKAGDVLWVRETFGELISFDQYCYKADSINPEVDKPYFGWKPSIFMPKPACRIFLKIKSIRVERLQEISESDAIAEGIIEILPQMYPQYREWKNYLNPDNPHGYKSDYNNPINSFKSLWQSINGKDSWNVNPFVWVYEFEQIEKPNDFIV